MDELTERVLSYQKDGGGKRELMDELMEFVYTYKGKGLNLLEEERSGFLLDFYPKIEKLLNKFVYKGYSFRTFLINSLIWHKKSLLQKREKSLVMDQAVAMECSREYLERVFNPSDYEDIVCEPDTPITLPSKLRSSVLCQFLFNSSSLCDEDIILFANRFQYNPEKLLGYAREIHRITEKKAESQRVDILRKDSLYMAKKAAEIRLGRAVSEEEKDSLQVKIQSLNRRIERLRSRIIQKAPHPTHTELAGILKIPRGTVSSRLYRIRKGMPGLYFLLQKEYVMRHDNYSGHEQSS